MPKCQRKSGSVKVHEKEPRKQKKTKNDKIKNGKNNIN